MSGNDNYILKAVSNRLLSEETKPDKVENLEFIIM